MLLIYSNRVKIILVIMSNSSNIKSSNKDKNNIMYIIVYSVVWKSIDRQL